MSDEIPFQPPPPIQPPPSPAFTPPKTSYHSARQQELDVIRRKGLAKIFNKHFTTVASKIQHEREAAEIALQELERRKAELAANPKSFNDEGMTLTQLEKLYMELRKKKVDVTRKERETQELYKRYVSQYGGSSTSDGGNVSASGSAIGPAARNNHHVQNTMPVVHEHSGNGIVWQSDLMHSKAIEMNEATRDADVGKLAINYNAHDAEDFPSPSKVGTLSPEVHHASVFQSSNYNEIISGSPPHQPTTTNTTTKTTSASASASASLALDEKSSSGDTPKSPTPTSTTSIASTSSEVLPQDRENSTPSLKPPSVTKSFLADTSVYSDSLLGGVMVTTKASRQNIDECDDDSSTMSGLTTIDGATVVEAEWRLTEFLRIETENIRDMFANEEDMDGESLSNDLISDNSHPSIIVGEVSQAAKKAEEMVRQMEEDTAWMKDPTLLDSDSEDEHDDDDSLSLPDLEWRCYWSEAHDREYYFNTQTSQTCWTKPQDVTIDFSSMNKVSSHNIIEEDEDDLDSIITCSLENDEDSVTVKDYTKSRQILVDAQILNPTEYTNEEMIDVFRPDSDTRSVGSRGSVKQSSKVLMYRRKRAQIKRSKRRLRMTCALLIASSIALFMYRKQWIPFLQEKIGQSTSEVSESNTSQNNEEMPDTTIKEASEVREQDHDAEILAQEEEQIRQKAAKLEQERIKQEESQRKEQERLKREEQIRQKAAKLEQERKEEEEKAKAEAQIRLKQEEEQRRKEAVRLERERQREEVQKAKAQAQRIEQEKLKQEEEKARIQAKRIEQEKFEQEEKARIQAQHNEELRLKEEEQMQIEARLTEELRRPWACGIPFAYVPARKCRMLSSKNPLYDCQSLVDAMME